MSDNLKRLREPAALAAAAFAGLSLLAGLINLLLPPSSDGVSEPLTDRSADLVTSFASLEIAICVAAAVYLANEAGPAFARSRLVTQVAFIEGAVALVFGVVTTLGLLGAADLNTVGKFGRFLAGVGGLAVVAAATWYARLSTQQHAAAAARTPESVSASWSGGPGQAGAGGGYSVPQPGQGQPGPGQSGPGQSGLGQSGLGGQQPGPGQPGFGQQGTGGPPPGGFGWGPQQGNRPQGGQQQGGQYPGQQGVPGGDRTQLLPPVPGQMGQMPPGGAGAATQHVPLVPPSMHDYAPAPQPWAPTGQGQGQGQGQQGQGPGQQGQNPTGPAPFGMPGQPQQQPEQWPDQRENPFTIGDWRE